jgi:hypothetical protein
LYSSKRPPMAAFSSVVCDGICLNSRENHGLIAAPNTACA